MTDLCHGSISLLGFPRQLTAGLAARIIQGQLGNHREWHRHACRQSYP